MFRMEALLRYLNGLSFADRADFCDRCGTSEGYLRKAVSRRQRLGEGLCISLDRESSGVVTCEQLRPDVDWAYLRGAVAVAPAQEVGHG